MSWNYSDKCTGNNIGSRCGWVDQLEIVPLPNIINSLDNALAGCATDWVGQTNVTHDGEDAAQSGEVGDWDTSWMWMTNSIIGPAQVKFWWKTDASSDDYLEFYIKDNEYRDINSSSISGDTDWQQASFIIPEGVYYLSWNYSDKCTGNNIGSRCGWVDQLEIGPLPDDDDDGLPDLWEQQFGGDQDPSTICANGIYTVWECYVAGLSPTDPNSYFTPNILVQDTDIAIHWPSVYGRFYSIYSTTNLLDDFLPLETNIPWGAAGSYITPLNESEDQNFYRIMVSLAPTNNIGQLISPIISLNGSLDFRGSYSGASRTKDIVIENRGNSAMTITGLSFSDTNFSGNWSGSLQVGETASVTVTFAPPSEGVYSGILTVNGDFVDGENAMVCYGVWEQMPYVDNGDGTVTDPATGLMWLKQANAAYMNWSNAVAYCENLVASGYSDWRLPSVAREGNPAEIDTLFRYNGGPSGAWMGVSETPFVGVQAQNYWTSVSSPLYQNYAWRIHMLQGFVDSNAGKSSYMYV